MEVLKSQQDFTSIELGAALSKASVLLDVHHQIASSDVFHDKVKTSVGLEGRMQGCQERMAFLVGHLENSLFRLGTIETRKYNSRY
jgi:hypothetical protein